MLIEAEFLCEGGFICGKYAQSADGTKTCLQITVGGEGIRITGQLLQEIPEESAKGRPGGTDCFSKGRNQKMKLKKLTIDNIASIEHAEIDFDASPLAGEHLFLISGETERILRTNSSSRTRPFALTTAQTMISPVANPCRMYR